MNIGKEVEMASLDFASTGPSWGLFGAQQN